MKYKAFRKLTDINSGEHVSWQLIAYIEAATSNLALRRARHVSGFCDWASKDGVIYEETDINQPDNWDKSTYIPPMLDGSIRIITKLDTAKNRIDKEIKERNIYDGTKNYL